MKKKLNVFASKNIKDTKKLNALYKSRKKNVPNVAEHDDMDDDETKQAKDRRVTFVLM